MAADFSGNKPHDPTDSNFAIEWRFRQLFLIVHEPHSPLPLPVQFHHDLPDVSLLDLSAPLCRSGRYIFCPQAEQTGMSVLLQSSRHSCLLFLVKNDSESLFGGGTVSSERGRCGRTRQAECWLGPGEYRGAGFAKHDKGLFGLK